MPVLGIIRQPRATLDAQPGTVLNTQRLERKCKHHRVPQQWLEVEQVVLEPADFVVEVLVGRVVPDVVVHEPLLEPDEDLVLDRLQAPCAFAVQLCRSGAGDQHALHDRLQSQVEFDRRAFGDTQAFDATFCQEREAHAIVKGLRAVSDFDYELQMAQMNASLTDIETVFVPTSPEWSFLASSLVKEVAAFGGDVAGLVPDYVLGPLTERLAARRAAGEE